MCPLKFLYDLKPLFNRCLIIGSGPSAEHFHIRSNPECDIIKINWGLVNTYARLHVCDKGVPQTLDRNISPILIGFKEDPVNYYFDNSIITGDHTGFRALQIADKIYKKIYLIGFDYYEKDGRCHYFGDDIHKMNPTWNTFYPNRKKVWKQQVAEFDQIEWTSEIYNCNKDSMLKRFPHEVPDGSR